MTLFVCRMFVASNQIPRQKVSVNCAGTGCVFEFTMYTFLGKQRMAQLSVY